MNKRELLGLAGSLTVTSLLPGCSGGSSTPSEPVVKSLGLALPDPLEVANRMQAYIDWGTAVLPKSIDNSGACPPVGDQGQMGSCVAWACGYGLASYVAAKTGGYQITNASKIASPADLYAKLLRAMPQSCSNGTNLRTAMDILCAQGLASHDTNAYSDQYCSAPTTKNLFRIKSYLATRADDRIGIKRQLASGNVLAFGANVTSDIFSISTGTYFATGSAKGGHALLLVGYDDNRSAYKVLNSWSTSYGVNGYFWFDYAAFERTTAEALSAVYGTAAPKPISNLPATVVSTKGSAITDTVYNKEFLYIFAEFSNLWTVESYQVKKGSVLIGGKTGLSQLMDASQFVLSKPYDGIGYLPGTYTLEMTGKDINNAALTLSKQVTILAFVAEPKTTTTPLNNTETGA